MVYRSKAAPIRDSFSFSTGGGESVVRGSSTKRVIGYIFLCLVILIAITALCITIKYYYYYSQSNNIKIVGKRPKAIMSSSEYVWYFGPDVGSLGKRNDRICLRVEEGIAFIQIRINNGAQQQPKRKSISVTVAEFELLNGIFEKYIDSLGGGGGGDGPGGGEIDVADDNNTPAWDSQSILNGRRTILVEVIPSAQNSSSNVVKLTVFKYNDGTVDSSSDTWVQRSSVTASTAKIKKMMALYPRIRERYTRDESPRTSDEETNTPYYPYDNDYFDSTEFTRLPIDGTEEEKNTTDNSVNHD